MLKTFSLFKKQTCFSVSKFAAHMKVGQCFYCELEEHCVTETPNILSWKEPTGIIKSSSSENGLHRGQTCDLGIITQCSHQANSRALITLFKTERILQVCMITFAPLLSLLTISSLLEYLRRKCRMTHRKGGTGNFVGKTRTASLQRGKAVSVGFSHKQSTCCVVAIYLKWLRIFNLIYCVWKNIRNMEH